MTQTVVEWLQEISSRRELDMFDFIDAKHMFQQQIEAAFLHGMTHSEDYFDASMDGTRISEERNYYNETYRK